MLLDVSPLGRHHDLRCVFVGQVVSAFGSFLTYVALPVQLYTLTHSSWAVGMIGTVQLVPLALTSLWGGALADAMDRRRLLLWCEALLLLVALGLAYNATLAHPNVALLFLMAAVASGINGFHRPALESLTQKLVPVSELAAVSALSSLRNTSAAIAGPALAGLSIATVGLALTFAADALTFAISLVALSLIRAMPAADNAPAPSFASIAQGLRYAASRPELIGTYVVNIVAMTFAMPVALFPAIAERFHDASAAGYLYSAMSVGSLCITVFSGWTHAVERRGAAVVIAAALWGVAIVGLGFASSLFGALLCLAAAGAADMVSGLFRMTIWNETIPTELRGRMAGLEQLSYMSGPLLGNARAGYMAERFGLAASIRWGGVACAGCVLACIGFLPAFWRYRQPSSAK